MSIRRLIQIRQDSFGYFGLLGVYTASVGLR